MKEHFVTFDTLIRDIKSSKTKFEKSDKVRHRLFTSPEKYDTVTETMTSGVILEFVNSRLLDSEMKFGGSKKKQQQMKVHAMPNPNTSATIVDKRNTSAQRNQITRTDGIHIVEQHEPIIEVEDSPPTSKVQIKIKKDKRTRKQKLLYSEHKKASVKTNE